MAYKRKTKDIQCRKCGRTTALRTWSVSGASKATGASGDSGWSGSRMVTR